MRHLDLPRDLPPALPRRRAGRPSSAETEALVQAVVDKSRRKLLVTAERFRAMLVDEIELSGGEPAPEAASSSLKALVAAFCAAGRGDELGAAAMAIVKTRSLAYDIT